MAGYWSAAPEKKPFISSRRPERRVEPSVLRDAGEELSMSKLTTKKREKLSDDRFALPGHKYPVEDAPHARNAKARAAQQAKAGKLSQSDLKKVDSKADRVLKRG
jgi:hypothetical protein